MIGEGRSMARVKMYLLIALSVIVIVDSSVKEGRIGREEREKEKQNKMKEYVYQSEPQRVQFGNGSRQQQPKRENIIEKIFGTFMASEKQMLSLSTLQQKVKHLNTVSHHDSKRISEYLNELIKALKSNEALIIAIHELKSDIEQVKTSTELRLLHSISKNVKTRKENPATLPPRCIIHEVVEADRSSLPELPPGEASEPLLTFMESIYKPARVRAGFDAGPPLLLTPYIEEDKLKEAREAAYVDPAYLLPDMDSYAGYLTVNKEYNANLFFWYFPVSGESVKDTPWLIWLQGGPGASSLYGLFNEIGPFFITNDNHLEEIQHSWGKNHSLLFIDNPVGTGFSFTDDDRGYATNQTTIGENLYTALQQFLTLFPELRKAPLTIAGESYAGKHIPSLGVQILWHRHEDEPINLHGLAIGNGFIDPLTLQRYSYFAREVGLLDDSVADCMNILETAITQFINEGEMVKAFAYFNTLLQMFRRKSNVSNLFNYLADDDIDHSYTDYIQTSEVRKALHVGNTNFTSIGVVYRKLVPDFMGSSKMWLEELLENYKVMLYNGHLDIFVAYHPSVNTYNSLVFSGTSEYKTAKRLPWYHDEILSGYYKVAGNLTEVMVRGAGHMVPAEKPAASLGLISAFARGIPLDVDTGYLVSSEQNLLRRRQLTLK